MKKLSLYITLITLSCLSILTLNNSSLANFKVTKKQAQALWGDHPKSFYCGCPYDASLNVDHQSCHYTPLNLKRAKKIEWEHLVPVSWFGKHRPCWQHAKKNGLDTRTYCEQNDPIFKKMLHDLHNLVPAIGEVNQARSAYGFSVIEPRTLFNGCELTIDVEAKKVEPKDEIKGTIARAHLYMTRHYGAKQLKLSNKEHKQYREWHAFYPPLEWEKTWNKKIREVQGTNNPLISKVKEA